MSTVVDPEKQNLDRIRMVVFLYDSTHGASFEGLIGDYVYPVIDEESFVIDNIMAGDTDTRLIVTGHDKDHTQINFQVCGYMDK